MLMTALLKGKTKKKERRINEKEMENQTELTSTMKTIRGTVETMELEHETL